MIEQINPLSGKCLVPITSPEDEEIHYLEKLMSRQKSDLSFGTFSDDINPYLLI